MQPQKFGAGGEWGNGYRVNRRDDMHVDLDLQDIETLLEATKYTSERVQNESGIGYEIRQQKLTALEIVQDKLRRAERANPTMHT
jgi:hypothetical protein